jgi:hypothetical protein
VPGLAHAAILEHRQYIQLAHEGDSLRNDLMWLFTAEGVAVGGAFDSDTAVGMMSIAHSRRRCASVFAIVIRRQEVRPMNAVSTMGAPLQSTIARLR